MLGDTDRHQSLTQLDTFSTCFTPPLLHAVSVADGAGKTSALQRRHAPCTHRTGDGMRQFGLAPTPADSHLLADMNGRPPAGQPASMGRNTVKTPRPPLPNAVSCHWCVYHLLSFYLFTKNDTTCSPSHFRPGWMRHQFSSRRRPICAIRSAAKNAAHATVHRQGGL